jgi:hypothetical protein
LTVPYKSVRYLRMFVLLIKDCVLLGGIDHEDSSIKCAFGSSHSFGRLF